MIRNRIDIVKTILITLLITGCSSENNLQQEDATVVVDLALSVSNSVNNSTRMAAETVQAAGDYRGITLSQIIPFAVPGKITKDDTPLWYQIGTDRTEYLKNDIFYLYEHCMISPGCASFLVYGRAPQGELTKTANGSIMEEFPLNMTPKNIQFELESISTRTAHATATALANYMTAIATANGNGISWKNAPSVMLRVMFLNFVHQTEASSSGELLPGSATDIKAYTQALKNNLNALTLTNADDIAIRTAIINKIETEYNNAWDNFPASIGLPDGAAVIQWNGSKFVPLLSNTSVADINSIDRFAYPAEVYYYSNSRIRTSNIDDRKETYSNLSRWNDILGEYEYNNSVVTQNTTSIAIKEPLQYAIARLQVKLKKTEMETLKDANNIDISVGEFNFPLTGIIVGGQLPVGFDFSPNTSYPVYSEAEIKFIYDSQVKTNGISGNEYFYLNSSNDATGVTNTLVLQSYDHQKVPVLLEFINNSGVDFKGQDGIVYRGTKFYLAGEVDPEEFKDDPRTEIRDRVFTQDYTTTLNMKVTSLAKAYNVVPNLLAPRLELGIELVPKWTSTTPEEIVL